jgi:uncharacterized protein YjbI with pentapeptide repeats
MSISNLVVSVTEGNSAAKFFLDDHLGESLTVLAALFGFLVWLFNTCIEIYRRRNLPLNIKEKIIESSKNYINPDYVNEDPGFYHEPSELSGKRSPLIPYLEKALRPGSKIKRFLILADSGMGKSSLMYNIYSRQVQKIFGGYKIALIELGSGNSINLISDINEKQNTVLLLDALDENIEAMKDYRQTLDQILARTDEFYRVIITCRTQFFADPTKIPELLGYSGGSIPAGEVVGGRFVKLFLAPFTKNQIKRFLAKKYLRKFRIFDYYKSKRIVFRVPNISVRPMLLSYIDFLINEKFNFTYLYQIHEAMITGWLKRRKSDVIDPKYKENLKFIYFIANDLAINLKKRDGFVISKEEAIDLAKRYKVEILDWQLTGRSLLNVDSSGRLKFVHLSFLEVLIARSLLEKEIKLDWEPTSQMKHFLKEMQIGERIGSKTDLFGADLASLNFARINLETNNFNQANLSHSDLNNCNLKKVTALNSDFDFSILNAADMDSADFTGASLKGAQISNVKGLGINFSNATLTGAELSDSIFTECNFTGTNLFGAELTNTKFINCKLENADLRKVRLLKTDGVDFRPNFLYSTTEGAKLPKNYMDLFLNIRGSNHLIDEENADIYRKRENSVQATKKASNKNPG